MASPARLRPSLDLVHRVIEAATANTMARHMPSPGFNGVTGLRRGQADRIQPPVERYREHGVAGRFEIAAGDDEPALGQELARLGYFQSGDHAALIGEPALELVTATEQMEAFLTAYVGGWGIPIPIA